MKHEQNKLGCLLVVRRGTGGRNKEKTTRESKEELEGEESNEWGRSLVGSMPS